jgi:hypothetical protein
MRARAGAPRSGAGEECRHIVSTPSLLIVGLSFTLFAHAAWAGDAVSRRLADEPGISIADARVLEGDVGTTDLVFTVKLAVPAVGFASVHYATFDGTAAVADSDYDSTSGTLVFQDGDTLATIPVVVHGDPALEGNEWLRVRLSDPLGCALADSEAFGWITNDERAVFITRDLGTPANDYRNGTLPSAWGDLNGDGYLDLPLFTGGPGGVFTETPGFRALLAAGNYHGVSTCDYDRDGDLDMVILGYKLPARDTPNLLLQNQGDGTFIDVAPQLGMNFAGNGETAVWGDFNGDGWPDLFAPFYPDVYPFQSFLWRNNADGTFTDIAPEAGVSTPGVPWTYRPEGAHAIDWNDDGFLDFYTSSHLFINDGTAHFVDIREAVGLPETFDEGSSMVDIDNDGDFDFYLRTEDRPRLFRNDAGHYTEITAQAGIDNPIYLWGDSWADVDLDGDLDLLQHGGHARLLLNQGDGTFVRDTTFEVISSQRELSCWGDIDNDGDQDVIIGAMGKQLMINHINVTPGFGRAHLRVLVLDAEGHMTQQGATVRLTQLGDGPPLIQTRVVDGGSGYLCQSEYTVEFGGVSSGRYALEVVFPSQTGTRWVVDSLSVPELGWVEADQLGNGPIRVYRDGRATFPLLAVAGVPRPPFAPTFVHRLGLPAPSPANRRVTVPITLDRAAQVAVTIHDLHGRLLRTRDLGVLQPGRHDLDWDLDDDRGHPEPTGVYFSRLVVDGMAVDQRRILVVR